MVLFLFMFCMIWFDSPLGEQQQKQQKDEHSLGVCSSNNNNNVSNNNNINNNSDSGLSLKMEDSSGGYNDVMEKGERDYINNHIDNDDDSTMADIDIEKKRKNSAIGNEMKNEEIATVSENPVAANALVAESDRPSTSTSSHIKRQKHNRSRNYRVSGRSSSSSSASSKDGRTDNQRDEQPPQEQAENQDSANPTENSPLPPANNNAAEESSPTSPFMFVSIYLSMVDIPQSNNQKKKLHFSTIFHSYPTCMNRQ